MKTSLSRLGLLLAGLLCLPGLTAAAQLPIQRNSTTTATQGTVTNTIRDMLSSVFLLTSVPTTNTILLVTNIPNFSGGELTFNTMPHTNKVLIMFGDPINGGAQIIWNPYHSGGRGELQIVADSIGMGSGWSTFGGNPGANSYRDIQLGVGEGHRPRVRLQYDHLADAASPFGWSDPLVWTLYWWSNGAPYSVTPGIQAAATSTNGHGGLRFYANAHDTLNGTNWDWATWGYLGGPLLQGDQRVGWDLRGKLVQERGTGTLVASQPLDFSARAALIDLEALGTTTTLYTTNAETGGTNYERKVWLLRAGNNTVSINYPTTWCTNGVALPASVTTGNLVRLELESIGVGESNKLVVSAGILKDQNWGFTPSALAGLALRWNGPVTTNGGWTTWADTIQDSQFIINPPETPHFTNIAGGGVWFDGSQSGFQKADIGVTNYSIWISMKPDAIAADADAMIGDGAGSFIVRNNQAAVNIYLSGNNLFGNTVLAGKGIDILATSDGTLNVYTNGVSAGAPVGSKPNYFNIGHLAKDAYAATMNGSIYEICVWTNAILTVGNAASLHTYATNRYAY